MNIYADNYEKKGYLLESFKIFRLTDTPPTAIPFHYHDFHKIILFLQGQASYSIEGKTYPLAPRDIIFVRAGEIHRPEPQPDFPYERIVIYVSPAFLKRYTKSDGDLAACFQAPPGDSSVMHLSPGKSHDLLFHMEKLEQVTHQQGFANELYIEMLFVEFMILLNRALQNRDIDPLHRVSYDRKIQPVIRYIQTHLTEDLTIDHLAAVSYLSRYYLMRRFKAATGYGIHQYIISKRLLKARQMLTSSMPLTELCYACGFRDYSAFSRAFRAMFQCTPLEYRKRQL